jgi:hypothetical protein
MEDNLVKKKVRTEILSFGKNLDGYFRERFSYKLKCVVVTSFSDTICSFNRTKFGFHFNFKPMDSIFPKNTLVITKLWFAEVRVGNGRDLLTFLVNSSQTFNIKYIALEGANKHSSRFAEKFGFKQLGINNMNWIGEIKDIENSIKK